MSAANEPVRSGHPLSGPGRGGGITVAGAGLVVLVATSLAVRDGSVGGPEREVFRAVNGLPDWLRQPLWLFQQMGNLAVAFLVVLLVAALLRSWRLVMAAVVAVVAKLGLERVVKSLVERRRPGSSIGDVVFHGHVPQQGLSFVSGHAVITTAMATALMAVLPRRWRPVPWVLVALNGFGRVYAGAHAPLDVVGGVALGLVIGGGLYAVLAWGRAPQPHDSPGSAAERPLSRGAIRQPTIGRTT